MSEAEKSETPAEASESTEEKPAPVAEPKRDLAQTRTAFAIDLAIVVGVCVLAGMRVLPGEAAALLLGGLAGASLRGAVPKLTGKGSGSAGAIGPVVLAALGALGRAKGVGVVVLAIAAATTLQGCAPSERVQLIRTALDHADRGCRAYLELRKEPIVEPAASPAADAGTDAP